MSLLSSLFQSDAMKNAAFGMVKKTMKEGNIKYMLIKLDDKDEIAMDTFSHDAKPVIVSQDQLDKLQDVIDSLNKEVDTFEGDFIRANDETVKLVEICKEQETVIATLNDQITTLLDTIKNLQNGAGNTIDGPAPENIPG